MKKSIIYALILALGLSLVMLPSVGCSKKTVGMGELSEDEQNRLRAEEERRLREQRLRESGQTSGSDFASSSLTGREAELRDLFVNQDIHFDYDNFDLRADAKQILNDKAAFLQANPQINIIIEGHCDERGSNAYNMALGEKRAWSAAAYLEAMGVAASRMEIVSYGEERPLVFGQTEEAFAANRRGHFVIK